MTLTTLLQLSTPPISITFLDRAPAGVSRVAAAEPAGCSYWKRAAAGEVFYTEAADHTGCPVGAHTHNVPLADGDKARLGEMIQTMVQLEYLDPAEVPGIPVRKTPFAVAVYAPLDGAPVAPDVVLVRGNARQLMLLAEAAQAAGAIGAVPTLGRPTCAVIPQAIDSHKTASSFACIGNRVYTGAADGEAYFAIPGASLAAVTAKLEIVLRANAELEKFHRARLTQS
jgi:uncharacterized protein (DUF169 family)